MSTIWTAAHGAPKVPDPPEVFISYSRKDGDLKERLVAHLWPLEKHYNLIRIWHDREVETGTDWKDDILQHLNDARAILCLVSADFLSSQFVNDIEIPIAIERSDAGEAVVIPILLRHCSVSVWRRHALCGFAALPKNGRPIKAERYPDKREEVWAEIVDDICVALNIEVPR